MPKVTFDGPNLRIIVNPGVTKINVESELYSEWKRWLLQSDNTKYLQAFRTFGGDETIIGQTAPKYFFVLNGWKIVIDGEYVTFASNLYQQDGGEPFIVLNDGGFSNNTSDSPTVSLQGGAPSAQEIYDFFMSKDAFNKDVNIVSVKSEPIASIDDFKADTVNVDLSTIPQAVWEYVTRELTVTAGLTPAQEAKIDQLILDVNSVQDANITSVNGVTVNNINEFKATETVVDLSGIPESVWTYVSRELTVAAGLTPAQESTLNQILTDVNGTLDANIVSVKDSEVVSVDDFKASETIVDLSGIPAAVWSNPTRDLSSPVVLDPLTQSKIDSIKTSSETSVSNTELLISGVDDISAITSSIQSSVEAIDLTTIPAAVWNYTARTLTSTLGLTPEQELKLDEILESTQSGGFV